MKKTEERRGRVRAAADLDLRFELAGRPVLARVRDLSASGVRFVADRALQPMTEVALVIALPGRDVACRGAVVRSRPLQASRAGAGDGERIDAYETAIFFTEIRDADRDGVEEFVSDVRGASEL